MIRQHSKYFSKARRVQQRANLMALLWLRVEFGMQIKAIAAGAKVPLKTVQYHWGTLTRLAGSKDPFQIYRWGVRKGLLPELTRTS